MCLLGLGCGLKPYTLESASGGEASSGTGTGDATLGGSVTGAGTAVTTGMVEETGAGSTADAVETCGPAEPGTKACDYWTQDCPEGCKCVPYSGDGDNAVESLKCVPVMPDAAGHGEPCTTVGGGVSGIDSCAEGYLCWDIDPRTLTGTCVEQCKGAIEMPQCSEADETCYIFGDSVLALCVPFCDPLDPSCPDGQVCVPDPMSISPFQCMIDASGEEGQVFDGCELANACDPGLMCGNPQLAEECEAEAAGCCLPFCDLQTPNCPGAGQQCLPWYEEGQAPAGFEALGVCGVPQ